VIAQEDHLALHDQIEALAGIWTISDHVPQAINFLNPMLGDVCQDGLESLKVTMDIANDRLHTVTLPGAAWHRGWTPAPSRERAT
jgi:hypothetical protein